ncbi:MAG: class I SAM-dependent methyltransferase [Anaerolineales bacterium]|nr:class I SAM-dependent methyltransferase [Anaerolineales bacterium]
MKAYVKKKLSIALKKMIERLGWEVFPSIPAHHYVPKFYGKSASKQSDIRTLAVFGDVATKVIQDKHTYLYYDRLFTIYQSLQNFASLAHVDSINTAELGVYRGGGSYFIASVSEKMGLSVNHYCFDTFEGHSAEDVNGYLEPSQKPGSFDNTNYEDVKEYLRDFLNISIYKGRFQDTCNNLNDKMFSFVHLDMDIYNPTAFALDYFTDRMVRGGVILLDDYGFFSCPGIEKAVTEFMSKNASKYFGIPLLTGQFILIRL